MMKKRIGFAPFVSLVVLGLFLGLLTVPAAAAAKAKKIDLNSATQAELESLKGIGAATAQKIIAARPFKSIEDLKNVSGIGQAAFADLKDLVTVKEIKTAATKKSKSAAKTKAKKDTRKSEEPDLIDLNAADQDALEALPGIGPALAEDIIAARPFKSIDELINIKGISQAKFDAIKDLVTLDLDDDEAVSPRLKPGQKININKASEEQLTSLLGIGPVKAKAIIAGRPYAKKEDIMKVKGIKEKTFAKIRDYIVVR